MEKRHHLNCITDNFFTTKTHSSQIPLSMKNGLTLRMKYSSKKSFTERIIYKQLAPGPYSADNLTSLSMLTVQPMTFILQWLSYLADKKSNPLGSSESNPDSFKGIQLRSGKSFLVRWKWCLILLWVGGFGLLTPSFNAFI